MLILISFKKIYYPLFLAAVLLSHPSSRANSTIEEFEKKEPVGLFFPIFIGDEKVRTFSYAPWGNGSEENATYEKFTIGQGSFYSKLAYYGESPLEFFEVVNEEREKTLKVSYHFDRSDRKREEILMLSSNSNGSFKVVPLDFSTEKVPIGSILLKSYSSEPIYISIGDKKIKLGPGKSYLFSPIKLTSKHVIVVAYLNRNGTYKQVFKKLVRKFTSQRNLLMMKTSGDALTSMHLSESIYYQKNITGLNSMPRSKPIVSVEDLPEPQSLQLNPTLNQ